MSSDTTDYFLDDLCLKITDGSHQSPKAFDGGMPMFSVKDMTEFGFDFSSVKTISNEDYVKLVDQGCRPLKDDVLIAKDGSVLKHVFKVENDLDAVLLSSIALLRPNIDLINPDYLVYSLMEPRLQNNIKSNYVSGSGVPRIVLKDFKKIPLSIPSLDYQEEVVNQVKSIDQKIHLNQQTNETLEAMAQAIFKSWLVDFDPVRAKIEAKSAGRDPNRAAMATIAGISLEQDWDEIETALDQKLARMSEARQQQLSRAAELFPDELVESEIGEVPKGWGESKLEDYINLSYGKSLRKSDRKEGNVPVYGSGGLTGTHNESLIDGPGIIVGRKGTVGSIYWEDKDFWPIDTVFYVEPKNEIDLSFYYYLMNTLGLDDMNTDAAVPGLNRNNAYRLNIPSFPNDLMNLFAEFTSDVHKTMKAKKAEKITLENLRDILLPKLISGEVEVEDI